MNHIEICLWFFFKSWIQSILPISNLETVKKIVRSKTETLAKVPLSEYLIGCTYITIIIELSIGTWDNNTCIRYF